MKNAPYPDQKIEYTHKCLKIQTNQSDKQIFIIYPIDYLLFDSS